MSGLFNWKKITPSEQSEDTTGETRKGLSLTVVDYVTRKLNKLTSRQCNYPAIPVDNGTDVTLRDGSKRAPINLKNLQLQSTETIFAIVTQAADGELIQWKPPVVECESFISIDVNGVVSVKPVADIGRRLKSQYDQYALADEATLFVKGVIEVTGCDGEQYYQDVVIPKGDVCTYCGLTSVV